MDDSIQQPPVMQSPPGAETTIDGQRYLYFGGTSYLGLAGHPEVIEAACAAVRQYGLHTATSRTGFGNNPATLEVERLAAAFFATESAFYFVSGYVSNHILIQATADRFDILFADESSHYSAREAARIAGKPITHFGHRNPADLEKQLRQTLLPGQRPLVMTDGVFPASGAMAPIDQYLRVLAGYEKAAILIDDAHGIAALGQHGRGTLEHLGLWNSNINTHLPNSGTAVYVCGTLSKAMGGFGGIIPGTRPFIHHARSCSHYYEGASAPPSPVAGATAKAIDLVMRQPQLRQRLQRNIAYLRRGLRELGLAVEDWPTPVIGVEAGSTENMKRIHRELRAAGIIVPYMAAYSGIGKEGLLRIAVCAGHTQAMLDYFLAQLRRLL